LSAVRKVVIEVVVFGVLAGGVDGGTSGSHFPSADRESAGADTSSRCNAGDRPLAKNDDLLKRRTTRRNGLPRSGLK
jgi:hypothetical protein